MTIASFVRNTYIGRLEQSILEDARSVSATAAVIVASPFWLSGSAMAEAETSPEAAICIGVEQWPGRCERLSFGRTGLVTVVTAPIDARHIGGAHALSQARFNSVKAKVFVFSRDCLELCRTTADTCWRH